MLDTMGNTYRPLLSNEMMRYLGVLNQWRLVIQPGKSTYPNGLNCSVFYMYAPKRIKYKYFNHFTKMSL